MVELKKCTCCKAVKPLPEFYPKSGMCADCCADRGRRYREEHKEQIHQWERDYYQRTRGVRLERERQMRKGNGERIKQIRAYDRRRHDEFIEKIMVYFGGTCQICGIQDYPEVYDVHHIDSSEKEYTVSQLKHKDWGAVVVPELAKCCLLCASCHRKFHKGRFPGVVLTSGEILREAV
jgi:hypothetical protein